MLTFEDVNMTEAEVNEGDEDVIHLPEPEIDFETDPFQSDSAMKPGTDWEDRVRRIPARQPKPPSPEQQKQRIRQILSILNSEAAEPTEDQIKEAIDWIRDMQSINPNHEEFVASSFQHYYPAWEELLRGVKRKSAKSVLSWIRKGFKPRFKGGAQNAKPSKPDVVVGMLRKVVPAKQIPEMLSGRFPHRVEFANHQSLYKKWDFTIDQVEKLMEYGAAGIWTDSEEPVVISPMGVVDSAGKDRLIWNGRYVNLFLEALPFRYEKLRDVLAFVKPGSFLATWDLKSGYFHVPIDPAYRKYFCFKIGSIVFYFKVLCFGFAQACYVFTKVMQEPMFELRKRGVPMSSYIDDALTAAETFGRCARQSGLSALLIGALGAFLGLPKCKLTPEQILKWLGFLIDTLEQKFKVGEAKIAKIKKALQEAVVKPSTTPRALAGIAGKIVSTSPAIMPAALFSRSLFQAIKGKASWDEIFPNPEAVRRTADFWLTNIDRLNGRNWWPKPVVLKVTSDASGVGFGGYLHKGKEQLPFTGTFSKQQAESSSTAREVRGYAAGLEIAAQQFPHMLREAAILIEGDNQGAIAAINSLRSPVSEINDLLKGVFEICAELGADVIGKWIPRGELTEADALSREPDATDWGISRELYDSACSLFGCYPSVDMFASNVHHTVDSFVSHFFTPGCLAVNALRLDWSEIVKEGQSIWVFPPVQCVSAALSLIEKYRIEAMICLPIKSGSNEIIQLASIKEAFKSEPMIVPRTNESCIPSCRVPSESVNPAFLQLGIVHIKWI